MNRKASRIASLLEDLGLDGHNPSVIAVGTSDSEIPGAGVAHVWESLSGTDELPNSLRADLGIVIAPLDFMSRRSAEQLLARLRDVHCDKVLLVDDDGEWTPEALRALGFLELERPSMDGRCYLFDPEIFNQPREWNNPSDWANPENFGKYRW